MAYVVALLLVAVGLALVLRRNGVTEDMARVPWWIRNPSLADPANRRMNSLVAAFFGVLFIGVGAYIAALAAHIAP